MLKVRREHILDDVASFFGWQLGSESWVGRNGQPGAAGLRRLYGNMTVGFVGAGGLLEEGVDEGGLSLSLYQLFFSEVLSPSSGLFHTSASDETAPLPVSVTCGAGDCHGPGPNSNVHFNGNLGTHGCQGCARAARLSAVGRVLAKQLVDGWVAPGPSAFVWHFLRGSHEEALSTVTRALLQLEGFDFDLARRWRTLLSHPEDAETLTTACFDPDAEEDVPVTAHNLPEAIRRGCRSKLLLERRSGLDALKRGFDAAGLGLMPRLWSVPELSSLMHGTADFDGAALWADGMHVSFDGFPHDSSIPAALCAILLSASLPAAWARSFLTFCTSLLTLPQGDHPQSLTSKPICVKFADGETPEALPTASVCVRVLYLPDYPDLATIRERLDRAFEYSEASGFQYA